MKGKLYIPLVWGECLNECYFNTEDVLVERFTSRVVYDDSSFFLVINCVVIKTYGSDIISYF